VDFAPPRTDHGGGRAFAGPDEVRLAYDLGKLGPHARIRLRWPGCHVIDEADEKQPRRVAPCSIIDTTAGRALFNAALPPGLPFYNLAMTSRRLGRVLGDCHRKHGPDVTVELLDRLKEIGFEASTRSGLSFATDDVPLPRDKPAALRHAFARVERLKRGLAEGDVASEDYPTLLLEAWDTAHKKITQSLMPDLRHDARNGSPYLNPLYVMADSGARGSPEQIRQLAGLRGLMASVSGRVIERPITASLREGLRSWDYFVSAYGSRKGLTDKGIRTAEAGYLTRKLVDAAQQVIVTEADCGSLLGMLKRAPVGTLGGRVIGRVSLEAVCDERGRPVIDAGELISPGQARRLAEMGRSELRVRSPLTCQAARGVCQRCYGLDLATRKLVEIGAAVGVIAAQSIGEPGTQLTLKTFQAGGVAGKDVVSDLERVTRLLEVSPVEDPVPLAPRRAVVRVARYQEGEEPAACRGWWLDETGADEMLRLRRRRVRVADGQTVEAGTPLCEGDVDLRQMLALGGSGLVGDYLLEGVRKLFREHWLEVDDRHFEVILSRMLGGVIVRDAGDTDLLPGEVLSRPSLAAVNRALAAGQRPAYARTWILGVSQAAARAQGFLAAASFQRAVKVLSEAAITASRDDLLGPKENVILGRTIPAGTGLGSR
jgi:DNA-directed RNA polymerase subunit beta'